ncbi:MAG: glycosyltransferase, partial [Bacteroidia bacterium]|nr:glycosyltransferase [Bacteroidia bacterium]
MTYTISIITATYNAAQHLPRLIASLRAQTNKNFEWIVA